MAIDSIPTTALSPAQTLPPRPRVPETSRADEAGLGRNEQARLNSEILSASLEVSIRSGNEPLQLTFRAIIDNLNEILRPDFGDDAIATALNQDNSPEGTAGRIVALSTGFFEAFAAQRPGDDRNQVLDDFLSVISRGIAQGFAEAREILEGLNVLRGDIASNIDRTEVLVRDGLEAFAQRLRTAQEETGVTGNA